MNSLLLISVCSWYCRLSRLSSDLSLGSEKVRQETVSWSYKQQSLVIYSSGILFQPQQLPTEMRYLRKCTRLRISTSTLSFVMVLFYSIKNSKFGNQNAWKFMLFMLFFN